MITEPRTAAGKRLMARAPKADMVKVAAYEASERAARDWEAAKAYHRAVTAAEGAAGF